MTGIYMGRLLQAGSDMLGTNADTKNRMGAELQSCQHQRLDKRHKANRTRLNIADKKQTRHRNKA